MEQARDHRIGISEEDHTLFAVVIIGPISSTHSFKASTCHKEEGR
jgi:hypothetical protein